MPHAFTILSIGLECDTVQQKALLIVKQEYHNTVDSPYDHEEFSRSGGIGNFKSRGILMITTLLKI